MKVGDKITLIGFGGTIVCTTVQDIPDERERAGAMIWRYPHGTEQINFADEGTKWIRGWYTPAASDVQAAQAANALDGTPPPHAANKSTPSLLAQTIGVLGAELVARWVKGDLTK